MTERIAFVNPSSGAGGEAEDPLVQVLRDSGFEIDDSEVTDLGEAAREHVDRGARIVAAVGGDGTHRTVAPAIAGTDAMYLPAPGGTFNHFPKDVGIPDAEALTAAIEDGAPLEVPIAALNGEPFLNTAVVGWYPEMVRTREALRQRMPRPLAAVVAFGKHVTHLHRFHVTAGPHTGAAWMIWAGNGRYGVRATELSNRDDVTDPRLDIRIAWAADSFPRVRLLWDLLRRRLRDSDHMDRRVSTEEVTVRVRARKVYAALDAEVVTLTPPLVFTPAAHTVTILTAMEPPNAVPDEAEDEAWERADDEDMPTDADA